MLKRILTKRSAELVDLAVKTAEHAVALAQNMYPDVIDTLAVAYFAQGNVDKAIETEERALKLGKGRYDEEEFNKRLLMFQQAKK